MKTNYKNKLILACMAMLSITNFIIAQVPSYVPTNGLAGYWPFTGNANDVSGNGNNGTNNGATLTTDRFGNANSAYSFNGTSNYLNMNSSTSLNTANMNQLSISGWFNSSNGGFVVRFGNPNITTGGIGYEIYVDAVNLNVNNWWNNQSPKYSYFTPRQNNQWQFFVIVFDFNANIASFYVNGILINTQNTVLHKSINPVLNIGRNTNGSSYFSGKIDDVGIWNRALTQQEITNLYQSEVSCQSLVINSGTLSSFNPPVYQSTVTIYPNPANDHITIDCGNLSNVNGWNIKISNILGQEVFSGKMDTQQYTVPLNTWGGKGVYFVKIYDNSNTLMNTKKIILQ